mmetsp:Transcript_71814/g.208040  ORF Transcript_71814/g.208040 Transcript_71814/m.208040 type:complete len:360 (-) Transcript_71814:1187-2266(-)
MGSGSSTSALASERGAGPPRSTEPLGTAGRPGDGGHGAATSERLAPITPTAALSQRDRRGKMAAAAREKRRRASWVRLRSRRTISGCSHSLGGSLGGPLLLAHRTTSSLGGGHGAAKRTSSSTNSAPTAGGTAASRRRNSLAATSAALHFSATTAALSFCNVSCTLRRAPSRSSTRCWSSCMSSSKPPPSGARGEQDEEREGVPGGDDGCGAGGCGDPLEHKVGGAAYRRRRKKPPLLLSGEPPARDTLGDWLPPPKDAGPSPSHEATSGRDKRLRCGTDREPSAGSGNAEDENADGRAPAPPAGSDEVPHADIMVSRLGRAMGTCNDLVANNVEEPPPYSAFQSDKDLRNRERLSTSS